MTAYQRLILPENLYYAWQKAKNLYRWSDGYIDHGELAQFELNLEDKLQLIQKKFETGEYQTKPIRPLPRPKKIVDGNPVNRQYFHVSVDDQVAWIAVVNAIGPALDYEMPPWSYGNRLYRPAWYKEEYPKSKLELGPYRHASGKLYQKFQHSWPLFRRHITLTARNMVHEFNSEILDEVDKSFLNSAENQDLYYLYPEFWFDINSNRANSNLYYAFIDFKHFFPNISSHAILETLLLNEDVKNEDYIILRDILQNMLHFSINKTKIPENIMNEVEPAIRGKSFEGIPTGLFVGGFLANVAMLPVDKIVDREIPKIKNVAHFRFVDDHAILAYDFNNLYDWINWYTETLNKCNIGVEINQDKIEPKSLANFISNSDNVDKSVVIKDTIIDGNNPIKLRTKTLEQVSLIANTNVNLLDDKDLQNHLNILEWLLLADIPKHEIRQDTRAAFAAGKIATLASSLVPENKDLIEKERKYEQLKLISIKQELDDIDQKLEELSYELSILRENQKLKENDYFRQCYQQLLQAFKEHQAKPRLFYQLFRFCRKTGYQGVDEIGEVINQMREQNLTSWANYYCGLTFQLIAIEVLRSHSILLNSDRLLFDKFASMKFIESVADLNVEKFSVPVEQQSWYYIVSKIELSVAVASIAVCFIEQSEHRYAGKKLYDLSTELCNISFDKPSEEWRVLTGQTAGVWAHLVESEFESERKPSHVWYKFEQCFDYQKTDDRSAARRYPEHLSEKGWLHCLHSEQDLLDSGWLRDVVVSHVDRRKEALQSNSRTLELVVRNTNHSESKFLTIAEWTKFTKYNCSPFDPRRSEWTALEIIRQILTPVFNEFNSYRDLNYVHPSNILIPVSWEVKFDTQPNKEQLSWKEWHDFLTKSNKEGIKFCKPSQRIIDYRYSNIELLESSEIFWRHQLKSIARLLIGILSEDHRLPRIWNIRGNEKIFDYPLAQIYRSLAISSKTLLLLDGCLSTRSAETRIISQQPSLFFWVDGELANDIQFDPPLFQNRNELLDAIIEAQQSLVDNQLSVSLNRPRQLIPFQLSHFSIGETHSNDDVV